MTEHGNGGTNAHRRQLTAARTDAAGCRRCDFGKTGTRTVFGAGPVDARLMFVGEQTPSPPRGLSDVPRYVTNAVKHFKWEPRGKRRIYKRPRISEMMACHVWLEREIAAVRPTVLVALGATTARAVLGPAVLVTTDRGSGFVRALGRTAQVRTGRGRARLVQPPEWGGDSEPARHIEEAHLSFWGGVRLPITPITTLTLRSHRVTREARTGRSPGPTPNVAPLSAGAFS